MNIKFDENYVFSVLTGIPCILLWRHSEGKYKGPVQEAGRIEFDSFEQMYQFQEMIELSIANKQKNIK